MTSRPSAALAFSLAVAAGLVACRRAPSPASERAPVRVAAAADLSSAFGELGRAFERDTGQPVVFSFGSTGLLAKQLREGAPFDLFAAASASFVDDVVAAGACDGSTKVAYARGRIALWSKRGGVAPPASLADVAAPRFKRVAIANPEHAPYGQAAREALVRAGVWAAVEPRLVLGENVRQALQLAETGNVEVAVVALSLVATDAVNPSLVVDEALHGPIDQALAVCNRGKRRDGGEAFGRYVTSEPGRAVMRRYGFLLPGETPARAP